MKNEHNEAKIIKYFQDFLKAETGETMKCCYNSIRDKNKNRFYKDSIDILDNETFDSIFPLVSVVILTANKIECDSLNYIAFLQDGNDIRKRRYALHIFDNSDMAAPDAYLFRINSFYVLHLNACETGANTPGGSTDLVRFIARHRLLRPTCIISFGVCYGRDTESQNIGDVIIPQKLYPWSIGQKISKKSFKIKHDNFNLYLEEKFQTSGIYSSLRDFCNGEDGRIVTGSLRLADISNKKQSRKFSVNVYYGNMSTGEAVVSSSDAKDMIRRANSNEKELGGEMEGYGLAKECIYYAKIPCFIIKAICDWGEFKDIEMIFKQNGLSCPAHFKDMLQAYAAFCAGMALMQLLHQHKDVLTLLPFIDYAAKSKNSRVSIVNYSTKKQIVKKIATYYRISQYEAEAVFGLFVSTGILQPSRDKSAYHVNPEI